MLSIGEYSNDKFKMNIYGTIDEPLFLAKEIGGILGIIKYHKTLYNVDNKWKIKAYFHQSPIGRRADMRDEGKRIHTFIKEPALYQMIMKSRSEDAIKFQEWICADILPSIRKTGKYEYKHKYNEYNINTFNIHTEYDLHTKVVQFIKRKYPESLFIVTNGEMQDTHEKRIRSYNMGYIKGMPDLIINNQSVHNNGLCIEFKSPKGTGCVSKEQDAMLDKYKLNGFKVLVSNSYDDIIETLIKYFIDVRIPCNNCNRKFKNVDKLINHNKYIHNK